MGFTGVEFDIVRNWIKLQRDKSVSWDLLFLAKKNNEDALLDFLQTKEDEDFWPNMTVRDWQTIVNEQKIAEEETIRFGYESGAGLIHGSKQLNSLSIPTDLKSSWQLYKAKLKKNGFKEKVINEIERSSHSILRHISLDTSTTNPIKGMVVGNVQSGKTANMAALMAMAADSGWNMFIILSGTIDNLRKQTEDRLFGDLHIPGCNIHWQALDHPSSLVPDYQKTKALQFHDRHFCYFTVCLKNKTRLKELIKWMQEDVHAMEQMKILVIDDEADQAGINTADVTTDERNAINGLIRDLVNGKNCKGETISYRYKAMNYIGYTATPYANVLNESSVDSLYPRDFITTLSVSNEYFGPQQIFGCEDTVYNGMDIIRTIPLSDIDDSKNLHKDYRIGVPLSLKKAVCWFFCGVACMRYWKYSKPISMLVHTSQKTDHHENVAKALMSWIQTESVDGIISFCHDVWEEETSKFTYDSFFDQYPDYGESVINNYPSFSDIKNELVNLLDGPRISNIPIADKTTLRYHKGIHLCVDNSKNNGINNDELIRLVYPKKGQMPDLAPAFIVVGGATLSRGLTIEGLISTYFLRSVKQSDTLMQMGRWFGYRKGYELIPRIWLSANTEEQFQFLSILDQSLRNEIHRMADFGVSPSEYGPRVVNSPRLSFIRIVAKNRMQRSQAAQKDYGGAASQTHLFDNNIDVLTFNQKCTLEFLRSLGNPEYKDINKHANGYKIWRNISFPIVRKYMSTYKFQERQSVFSELESMFEWIQKLSDEGALENWNVVLVGVSKDHKVEKYWEVSPGIGVYKISRSQLTKNIIEDVLEIGALRAPKDLIADIDLDLVSDEEIKKQVLSFKSKYPLELREKAGLSKVPQLLVYVIDKDSKAESPSRKDLEAKEDVVGLSFIIPGESRYSNNTATISVILDDLKLDDDIIDLENEN